MKKLFIFDLDNTLSESRMPIDYQMATLVCRLLSHSAVAVISGESFEELKAQVVSRLSCANEFKKLFILPTSGADLWHFDGVEWRRAYGQIIAKSMREKVTRAIAALAHIPNNQIAHFIEDRGAQVTYSALGLNASVEKKTAYDPTQTKRRDFVRKIAAEFPELSFHIGGKTSIDVTMKGIDKAFGIRELLAYKKMSPSETVFVGDALYEGGNDSGAKTTGVEVVSTSGPEETKKIITRLLAGYEHNLPKNPVAYFVSEYALSSLAPTYAGGLGILAGDYLLEAAKENFPFVLVSLRYGIYDASSDGYNRAADKEGEPIVIHIEIEKREVAVCAWIRYFNSNVAVILLDTDIPENSAEDRAICKTLYDSHLYVRIKQQIILGCAGPDMFSRLGITPRLYHLNEGHTSLTALGIIALEMKNGGDFFSAIKKAKEKSVFTKHTIFSDAGLYIASNEFFDFVSRFCSAHMMDTKEIFKIGQYEKDEDLFSTTRFGIRMSARRNAVSRLHMHKEKEIHPSSDFSYVTNGIFKDRWRSTHSKSSARGELIDFVYEKTGVRLDRNALTIVWARRFAAYKRPKLIFSDISRLKKILFDEKRPVQIVVSGKAHPSDEEGQKTLEIIRGFAEKELRGKLAYVPDYSIDIAEKLVRGADLWVNTPERGKEACGTSGMKAGLSGALMCTISDGWVDEANLAGIGWILPEEKTANTLYGFLEREIVPEFWDDKNAWDARMKKTQAVIESHFGTERMLSDYRKKIYFF